MRWQAILFDLDDTLYSRADAFSRTLYRFAEIHIAPVSTEPVDVIANQIASLAANRELGSSPKKPPEFIAERVKIDYPSIPETERDLTGWFQDELVAQLRPDCAVQTVFARLAEQQVPWCIVTNGDEFQLKKIAALGIETDRERIIMSDVEGWQKPDARLFNLAIDRLGVQANADALMVGDNPTADIQGARNAGLSTAWMTLGREWDQVSPPPDIHLNTLGDLLPHL